MSALRRLWWRYVRRYAYEMCDACGRPVGRAFGLVQRRTVADEPRLSPATYWFADNALWNEVNGSPNGLLCPTCFTASAETQGIAVGWRAGVVGDIEELASPSAPNRERQS